MTIKNPILQKAPLKKKLGYFLHTMTLKSMEKTINEAVRKRDVNDKS